jgi:hypothetical protein
MTSQQEALARAGAGEPLLPFTEGQALVHGRRLRAAGITYTSIARVMTVSHGVSRSSEWWRRNLRARGAPPLLYKDGSSRPSPAQHRKMRAEAATT